MNFKAAFQKHIVAVAASMAGGALAGGAIVLALTSASPQLPTAPAPRVAEVVSPSPFATPVDPSPAPTDAPSPTPTTAPTAAPAPVAPATAAPTSAPAPPPPPSCPTGQTILSQAGTGRWDGTFTVPSECATYTYRWTFGPVPAACRTWTLAFYPDVNGQGHEYTQAGAASGGGSESVHNPGARVAGEVNLYNNTGCPAISWSITVTAG